MSTLQRRRMMMIDQGVAYDGIPLMITNVGDEPSVITLIPYGSFNARIYYKKDDDKFYKKWNYNAITLPPNSTLSLFGDSDVFSSSSSNYANFSITGSSVKLSGRLASISHKGGVAYTYYKLFQNCTSVVEVSSDFLEGVSIPTTGYSGGSNLSYLFSNTGITRVPEGLFDFRQSVNSIYVCRSVYAYMFMDCKSLVSVPQNIFAKETFICQHQYRGMFSGCSSLTQAPDIYATNAPYLCYESMFANCVNLENPPQILFNGYGGTQAFSGMFQGCTSLKQSPIMNDLIKDGEEWGQHRDMFIGCSSLNRVEVSFTQWKIHYQNKESIHTSEWLINVSPTGTFICPKELADATDGYYDEEGNFVKGVGRGVNTVPKGWYIDFPVIDARDGDANAIALMAVISQQTHADGTPWVKDSLVMMKSEAEKVTDIGTIFKENDSIIDFTALQYFKLSEIKAKAFYHCSKLTKVVLPNTITSLGDNCFNYSYIEDIIIPDSVTTISGYVNGYNTKRIYIGKGVTSIAYRAFISLRNCESIEVHPDNQYFDSRENCNAIIQKSNNQLLCGCVNTIIPNSVTSIGSWAFTSNTIITELTIPKSVIASNSYAFNVTMALKTIYYEGSLIDWFKINFTSSYANPFRGKTGVSLIIDGENVISETMIIPEGVTSVGTYVFPIISDIKHIVIPSSVTSWNTESFYGNSLESIVVDNANAKYDSRENCNAIVETSSNKLIYACKNTIIPNSVIEIGNSAFMYTSVSSVIEIPESVKKISSFAFNKSEIKTIKINAETPPVLASTNVFASNTIIYVPDNSVDSYKSSDVWSTLANRIKPLSELPQ